MLKTYYIKTFGCQMNYADSEKIDMILRSAGFRKVTDPVQADAIVMNTCSVRQKGEDRVFGFMHEIERYHKKNETGKKPLFGITGCMVRKSGLAKRYLKDEAGNMDEEYKRQNAEKIVLLDSSEALENYDDELFLRSQSIDFVFRIEEVSYLTKILSLITGEDIGNDAKFNEYLAVKQLQENPSSANIIIQTGCDNFCTFCIVPHTRGREASRPSDEIVAEIEQVVKNGTKEITLLGQNVNSYGKETKKKMWNDEEMRWIKNEKRSLNIAIDIDDTIMNVWRDEMFEEYNKKYSANLVFEDIKTHGFNGDLKLKEIFFQQYYAHQESLPIYENAKDVIYKLKKDGHILSLLTSRPEGDKIFTKNWAIKEFGADFFENILFSCDFGADDKSIVAQKYGFDLVIDDAEHHIEGYSQNTDAHILMYSQPWNQHIEEAGKKYRVNHWNDILVKIDEISHSSISSKTPFRELLEKIDDIDGIDRIRFTSSNPHDMTRDILDAHFELPNMCNYLHIALQSGSDTMLTRMNRKHTYADFKSQVDYLRDRDTLFSISTDIIVGFPGETEEEFQATATAMRECQFDFAFIARYSSRSGTLATTRYEDDISSQEKARRWTILNDILRETAKNRNLLMVGREEEILITGEGKDETLVGRTRNFKEVFIPYTPDIKVGDIVLVKIVEGSGWVLKGERV
ncbi:radical SAM protein [Candidatus Gracilibacteria bacterium]|nr:radical SAM protein [Candidatus Gracilibacteria bacterium]